MISVDALNKSYGESKVLKNLSFDVKKGEILGLLGPNGAGKSTTMKILSGYIPADNGSVVICGNDIYENRLGVQANIGYLPETVPLYNDMRVREYLSFRAELKGVSRACLTEELNRVIRLCWLETVQNAMIGNLSKGYRQRTGLADAMLNDPDVLILDEPTSGLDPEQIVATRELIKSLKSEKAILLSTHILAEVELSCDKVLILNNGLKVAEDTPDNLKNKLGTVCYEIEIRGLQKEVSDYLDENRDIIKYESSSLDDGFRSYSLYAEASYDPRIDFHAHSKNTDWNIRTMKKIELNLEEVFMNITKK